MNKLYKFLLLLFSVTIISFTAGAQSFSARYDFSGVTSGVGGKTDPTPVPTATGVTFGSFSAVGGMSANPNAGGRFSFTGWPLGATNGSDVFTGTPDPGEYYEVTITPDNNYTIDLSSITFTSQRSGTGVRQWIVRSSVDGFTNNLPASINPDNSNLSVVGDNVFQIKDAATTAQNGCTVTLSSVSGFAGASQAITFRFYGFNAEQSGGTFSLDNVEISGTTTINPNAPDITLSSNNLTFASVPTNTTSGIMSYTVQGNNLTDPLVITTAAPFSVSDDANGTFGTSLSFQPADVTSAKTVYVKFTPDAIGSFAGTISLASTGAATQTVNLFGQGVDPDNLAFDFNTCSNGGQPGSGWIQYSVAGSTVWTCTTFGRNETTGVNMNGFSDLPDANEDWLISPSLNISAMSLPVLSFWSRGEFSGPSLKLMVSTDYSGSGDPHAATWTDMNAFFPPLTNTWTFTDGVNLSAYKSASKVYVAFVYTSDNDNGAARWTLDDVNVTDRTSLLTVTPPTLSLGEASVGNPSNGLPFTLQSIGYGAVTVTAPDPFQISSDNVTYSSTVNVTEADAQSGVTLYARLAPTVKQLIDSGRINIKGTDLDSNTVLLVGTSLPRSETLDIGTYNLSFFGNNSTNTPTLQEIATQRENIATVLNHLNLDIVGVEEISNDTAFANLVNMIPNAQSVVSDRWSYSFNAPDPNFPPQKIGIIYNSSVATLVDSRVMFTGLYDSARTGLSTRLSDYPGGAQSFWASGRLPFMATFNVSIGGVTKQVRVIDIHAKAGADQASFTRRGYDAKVLFDTLKAQYANDYIILVGDYNDRTSATIYGGSGAKTPYLPFENNGIDSILTYPLDAAGMASFISGSGIIDNVTISNRFLNDFYIPGSTTLEDPRSYIGTYNATTASDHFPVYSRFDLTGTLPVVLMNFNAVRNGRVVDLSWQTAQEKNTKEFVVERSADGTNFSEIGTVQSAGNSSLVSTYAFTDANPANGVNFYRLRSVDLDGHFDLSKIVKVTFDNATVVVVSPNPARDNVTIRLNNSREPVRLQIANMNGKIVREQLLTSQTTIINVSNLSKGLYIVKVFGKNTVSTTKLVVE